MQDTMKALLVTAGNGRINWPFPFVNGQQTPESLALMADKGQHRPTPINLDDIEEALL